MLLHKTQVERDKNWTIIKACQVLALSQNALAKDPKAPLSIQMHQLQLFEIVRHKQNLE